MIVVLGKFKPTYEKGDNGFMDDLETWTVPSIFPSERRVMIKNVDLSRLLMADPEDIVSALDLDFEYVE